MAAPPEEYVAFVREHGARVARACAEITANDELARAMRADLLAAVAARWTAGPAGAGRALVRLRRLLLREARGNPAATRAADAVGSGAWLAVEPDPEPVAREVAARAWERGHRVRRQRWTVAGVAVLLVAVATVFSVRDRGGPTPQPRPTVVPDLVSVLRPFDLLAAHDPFLGPVPLPQYLDLQPSTVDGYPALSPGALTRVTVAAAANRGRLVLYGDRAAPMPGAPEGGIVRRVEEPVLAAARLLATSLSPDGTFVALPRGRDLVTLDVRTATVRVFALDAPQLEPPVLVWLNPTTVAVPAPEGSLTLDVTTGRVSQAPLVAEQVVTLPDDPTGPPLRLAAAATEGPSTGDNVRAELISGEPPLTRTVIGPPWLSAQRGPAWGSSLLVLRACDPATLALPAEVGVARSAVMALRRDGGYLRTLVSVDAQLDILNMIGLRQAVVAVHRDGRTLVLAWAPEEDLLHVLTEVNGEGALALAGLLSPA